MYPTKILLNCYDMTTGRTVVDKLKFLESTRFSSHDHILKYQQSSLNKIIEYALNNTIFYKNFCTTYKHVTGCKNIKHIPIISKDDIRNRFEDFIVCDKMKSGKICIDYTGGSTGQPLKFAYNDEYKDIRWAIIYHNLSWVGYMLGNPHGFIYGSNADTAKQYSFRQKMQNFMMNSFQTNAFFLNSKDLLYFAQKCKRKRTRFLIGYASALCEFAEFCAENNILLNFNFIESTSEFLSLENRNKLEGSFSCKVFNRYGCREVGNIAHECIEQNGMHINWQTIYVEIINKGGYPDLGPEYGDIVITSLENKGMPLLRYKVGDIGQIETEHCKCGMKSPRLFLAGARTGDLLYTPSGHKVSPPALTLIYKDLIGIKKIQFIQKEIASLEVNIVREDKIEPDIALLKAKLLKVFGNDMEIAIRFSSDIPRERSGKYRLTMRLFS